MTPVQYLLESFAPDTDVAIRVFNLALEFAPAYAAENGLTMPLSHGEWLEAVATYPLSWKERQVLKASYFAALPGCNA